MYRRVLVYGPPGVGKTCFAASFPPPVLILDTHQGTNYVDQVVPPSRWKAVSVRDHRVLDAVLAKATEGSLGYQTVVVDTLFDIQRLHLVDLAGPRVAYRVQEWAESIEWLRRTMYAFLFVPLHVVYICPEAELTDGDSVIIRPDLGGKARGYLLQNVDFAFYMGLRLDLQGQPHRVLFTQADRHRFYAKCRDGRIPAEIVDPTYEKVFGDTDNNDKEAQ